MWQATSNILGALGVVRIDPQLRLSGPPLPPPPPPPSLFACLLCRNSGIRPKMTGDLHPLHRGHLGRGSYVAAFQCRQVHNAGQRGARFGECCTIV